MEVLFVSLSITFLVLFLTSVIATIIGFIKPHSVLRWGDNKKRTKGNVIKYYGISIIVCLIIGLTSFANLQNIKAVKVAKAEVELARITAEKVASDKVIADKKVADKLKADKVIKDKAIADKAKADKVIKEKAIADKVASDKEIANKEIESKSETTKVQYSSGTNNTQKASSTPKQTTTTATTKTTTNTNDNELRALHSQLQALESNQAKLAEHSQAYRDGLLEKQKLLQQIINLSK
ncbi:MAG TPA: hypothetical protein VIK26_09355 [Clostridium sp.]